DADACTDSTGATGATGSTGTTRYTGPTGRTEPHGPGSAAADPHTRRGHQRVVIQPRDARAMSTPAAPACSSAWGGSSRPARPTPPPTPRRPPGRALTPPCPTPAPAG